METHTDFVRRCRWCELSLGHARYFVAGVWEGVFSPVHFFGEAKFTDGLCPECFQAERLKWIKATESISPGARLGEQTCPVGGSRDPQSGRRPLLSVALVRVLSVTSWRILVSTWVRRLFCPAVNARGHRLGRWLAVSHREWLL